MQLRCPSQPADEPEALGAAEVRTRCAALERWLAEAAAQVPREDECRIADSAELYQVKARFQALKERCDAKTEEFRAINEAGEADGDRGRADSRGARINSARVGQATTCCWRPGRAWQGAPAQSRGRSRRSTRSGRKSRTASTSDTSAWPLSLFVFEQRRCVDAIYLVRSLRFDKSRCRLQHLLVRHENPNLGI